MIDFHTHLLPGIDDGSQCLADTIEMATEEKRQGTCHIIATPHFYASRNSLDAFLAKRNASYDKTVAELSDRPQYPTITMGAEVYYFAKMGKAEMLPRLCIGNTSCLLLEMPFCQWTQEMADDIRTIISKRKITVILAHLERYIKFQKNKEPWEEILSLPVVIQLNGEAFLDWRRRRFALKMVESGRDILLGSDCHNMTGRKPNLMEARAYIQKKLGEAPLNRIDALGEAILRREREL